MLWRGAPETFEPEPALVDELVLAAAARHGDRPALIDARSGRRLTFAQLADGAGRLAAGLAEQGIRPGDRITLVAANCPDFAVALYGGLAAGAAVAAANPALTAPELARQFAASEPRLVFTDERSRAAVAAAGAAAVHRLELTGVLLAPRAARVPGRAPADVAVLLPSSGTSGMPKLAVHTHAGFAAFLQAFRHTAWGDITPRDVVANFIPFTHLFGMAFLTYGLCSGATTVTTALAPGDLETFLRTLADHGVTVAPVTPPLLQALAHDPAVDAFDLSRLRLVFSSAAVCPPELRDRVEARLGCVVTDNLGSTEAWCVAGAADPVVRGSVGRLCPGLEAVVVDPDTGARLGAGEPGELWVRGPQVMAGYLHAHGNPDGDGWLHTGDLCRLDAEGNVYVVDRLKELIKVAGYSVAPAEVERELAAHPAVADAAVVGRPDPHLGEVPVAFVALNAPVAAAELRTWLAGRLAEWKQPRAITVIERVPRTPVGKLLRRELQPAA
ncbi:MAG TPA: AMP-binding protein [Solirubrobacteraceae bacterium]|jgi:acyl-CoA synthetase (AMP-forming)/AMP-acid ligase II